MRGQASIVYAILREIDLTTCASVMQNYHVRSLKLTIYPLHHRFPIARHRHASLAIDPSLYASTRGALGMRTRVHKVSQSVSS